MQQLTTLQALAGCRSIIYIRRIVLSVTIFYMIHDPASIRFVTFQGAFFRNVVLPWTKKKTVLFCCHRCNRSAAEIINGSRIYHLVNSYVCVYRQTRMRSAL